MRGQFGAGIHLGHNEIGAEWADPNLRIHWRTGTFPVVFIIGVPIDLIPQRLNTVHRLLLGAEVDTPCRCR